MVVVFHLLNAAKLLIIVDAVLSWILGDEQFPRSLTKPLLDPVYRPIRSVLGGESGPVDLSPLVVLGAIFAIEYLLKRSGNEAPR